ncbi:ankyrin repeat domain-containing protein [Anthocerotibacter panamensis]|uniref:ankyrin repeat domain-containing protein n=1 Tax=Anthocerotibacter panamensis TaxID=2857077 RepID=UPI001C4065AD|nr:ankyrin repeat domain-containing protein [Anthocerotibacter panamensis]
MNSVALSATELLRAVAAGEAHTVKALLTQGMDVNAQDDDGMCALVLASFKGHMAVVEVLLEAGADVDAKTNYGVTPLKAATMKGHQQIVEILTAHQSLV